MSAITSSRIIQTIRTINHSAHTSPPYVHDGGRQPSISCSHRKRHGCYREIARVPLIKLYSTNRLKRSSYGVLCSYYGRGIPYPPALQCHINSYVYESGCPISQLHNALSGHFPYEYVCLPCGHTVHYPFGTRLTRNRRVPCALYKGKVQPYYYKAPSRNDHLGNGFEPRSCITSSFKHVILRTSIAGATW